MKWWPRPLEKGDIIRVLIGSVQHYGIFVSEEEVIQFGPPPTHAKPSEWKDFCVMSTDIDCFSCGIIPQAATPEAREEQFRFSPDETVERAKARLGEKGYNIIHNNCEHFVYECAYGVKRSVQAEEVRRRWHNRPLLNVYLFPFGADLAVEEVYPPERNAEILAVGGMARLQKYAVWKALEMGFAHAFGVNIRDLSFEKNSFGKWCCDKYQFSLSHTENAVAVALSTASVGVDLENVTVFAARHGQRLQSLYSATLTEQERILCENTDVQRFLGLWTRKESVYKAYGEGHFQPQKISGAFDKVKTVSFTLDAPMVLSVSGDLFELASFYIFDGERPCRLNVQNSELDLL